MLPCIPHRPVKVPTPYPVVPSIMQMPNAVAALGRLNTVVVNDVSGVVPCTVPRRIGTLPQPAARVRFTTMNAGTVSDEKITETAEFSVAEPAAEPAAAVIREQLDLIGADLNLVKQRLPDLVDAVTVCSAADEDSEFVPCFAAELKRHQQAG